MLPKNCLRKGNISGIRLIEQYPNKLLSKSRFFSIKKIIYNLSCMMPPYWFRKCRFITPQQTEYSDGLQGSFCEWAQPMRCNIISHRLGIYTKLSLVCGKAIKLVHYHSIKHGKFGEEYWYLHTYKEDEITIQAEWRICVSTLTIIGLDNGWLADQCQAIIWTNDGILFIRPLGTNFSEISKMCLHADSKQNHTTSLCGYAGYILRSWARTDLTGPLSLWNKLSYHQGSI